MVLTSPQDVKSSNSTIESVNKPISPLDPEDAEWNKENSVTNEDECCNSSSAVGTRNRNPEPSPTMFSDANELEEKDEQNQLAGNDEKTGDKSKPVGRRILSRKSKLVLLAFTTFMLSMLPFQESSHVLVQPGPLFGVELTSLGGSQPVVAADTWSFTTISVKRLNWLELTLEQIRNPDDVFPSAGTSSQPAATSQMAAAKMTAAAVADYLLYNLSTPTSWVITSLLKDAPAADYGLLVNDRITAANGEQINSVGELRKILDAGSVRLKILRGRESIEVVVDVSDRGVLGVELAPVGLPQRIDPDSIRTEDVGGGSAGLMFTLALLDSNSDGDLSGGSKIAGTGTINPDGTVGPIVGASYKFIAAEAAGVEVFFVPSTLRSQLPKTSKVEIVAVDDVVDAVRWLCEHGGSSPELCRK